jgi:2-haloacid dehalogenase
MNTPARPRYQLLSFDVYTALADVEGSLVPTVRQALPPHVDSLDLVRTWRRKQLEYALISNSLDRGRVSFSTITRHALEYALGRAKVVLTETALQDLVAAWDQLQLWPEAESVLTEIAARGYRIGLLSNGDETMLRALAKHWPIRFDDVFASDRASYYKPHPSVYALPLEALGLAADQMLHIAGSATDVTGAKSAGLRCVWSNRGHDLLLDPRLTPDYEIEDLRGLLPIL